MHTVRVLVVGGGITGLAAARRLNERLSILGRPFEITILEASDRLGGVIGTESREGFLIEKGPDCFITEKARGIGLCQEMGISRDLLTTQAVDRRSFIGWQGKLHVVPTGFHLLAPSQIESMLLTPLLSLKGKARLLKEYFIPPAAPEDESVASFVRRRFGPEVLERLAQPLAGGTYGADPEKLSLRATFPKFLELEKKGSVLKGLKAEHSKETAAASGARYSLFVTLKKGLQELTDQLRERLGAVKVELKAVVQAVSPFKEGEREGWRVQLTDGRILEAEGICLALSAPMLAHVFQPIDGVLAGLFRQIPYGDSLSVHFAFPAKSIGHPMNGFGFVVPAAEKKALSACTFVHRKFEGRAPVGFALLRAFVGSTAAVALRSASGPDIEKRLLAELNTYLKISGKPIFSVVHRYAQALPQYAVGHVARLKELDARLYQWRAISLAGNWRRGVGVPDCIESGEQAADVLINALCRL